jgi:STE24 endopeptidase
VNEPKSSRYHRLARRATSAGVAFTSALLTALMASGASVWLASSLGGSAVLYTLVLVGLIEAASLPVAWYRGCVLERQFGLSQVSTRAWLGDFVKGAALVLAAAACASMLVYGAMRLWPDWWWAAAASELTAGAALVTLAAPVLILPLFHRSRPLGRELLRQRIVSLCDRAGIEVLDVREWLLGDRTRRAGAVLIGAGATRRILLSDTLLADYTDDEIEVILAHEMGHHAHGDVLKGLAGDAAVLACGFLAARVVLEASWARLGLSGPADAAGVPLLMLTVGAVTLAARPVLNGLSRRSERRADRFAIEMTSNPAAFAGAVRRIAAQNLSEEHPSRLARWMFHTHPPVEERIASAMAAAPRTAGAGLPG